MTVNDGTLTTVGKLFHLKRSTRSHESTLKMAGPNYEPVTQMYHYVDADDNNSYIPPGETTRVVEIPGASGKRKDIKRIPVQPDIVSKVGVGKDITPNTFSGEVSNSPLPTIFSGNYYIFVPTRGENAYSIIFNMVEQGSDIWSEVAVSGSQNSYKLIVWDGYLVLASVLPEKQIREPDALPERPFVEKLDSTQVEKLEERTHKALVAAFAAPRVVTSSDVAQLVTQRGESPIEWPETPEMKDESPLSADSLLSSLLA